MSDLTCGEAVMGLVKAYGVDTVFGIPGVHTLEFYRGLARFDLRHVTVRHEQGAAFMADGYARASGRPGMCLLISGPGVTNAATAIAESYSDSIPTLVLSSVQGTAGMGMGRGELHEITSQRAVTAPLTGFSATALAAEQIPELIARAFALFATARPRPVHIEIPVDLLAQPADFALKARTLPEAAVPGTSAIATAAQLMAGAKRPVMLVGGGAHGHGEAVTRLAERIGAAVIQSRAGKGIVPEDHPLCLGFAYRRPPGLELIREADVVVAVATEIAPTDHWQARLGMSGKLVRIDIDPAALARDYPADAPLCGDVGPALAALLAELGPSENRESGFWASEELAEARRAAAALRTPKQRIHIRALAALRRALPRDAFVAADSTQLAYTGSIEFPCHRDRAWMFPVGYGTLGYGLPAAIGAKLAEPSRPGAVIVGDGGFLFTLGDLATAVEQRLSLPIIVWNNAGYGQIRDDMRAHGYPELGVALTNPDFVALGKSFGCEALRPDSLEGFEAAVTAALTHPGPTLIELREDSDFLQGS
jgi:thiamine pyrophosphate-dependent acetolactate synthase large subunit-like protein